MQRVLLAEDDAGLAAFEATLLRTMGFDVTIAPDGAEALALLHARPFDLVVTDYRMPRMDGIALIEAIRADLRLRGMPIVCVTAEIDRRDDLERAGANVVLGKPFRVAEMRRIAVACLAG